MPSRRSVHRWDRSGMLLLGAGLIANTLLGPLFADAIDYPFTETVRNETLGLEAISLVLIDPWRWWRACWPCASTQRPASSVSVLPPTRRTRSSSTWSDPQYMTYEPAVVLHLALFVLSLALLVQAWAFIDVDWLPTRSRGWAVVVFLLAGFVTSRWAGAIAGTLAGDTVPAAAEDVTMYWSILLLDLGIVVPVAVATGIGLLLGHSWATKALYGVVGWFALVPTLGRCDGRGEGPSRRPSCVFGRRCRASGGGAHLRDRGRLALRTALPSSARCSRHAVTSPFWHRGTGPPGVEEAAKAHRPSAPTPSSPVLGEPQLVVVRILTQHLAGTARTALLLATDTSPVRNSGLASRADAVPAGSERALSLSLGHACAVPCAATAAAAAAIASGSPR